MDFDASYFDNLHEILQQEYIEEKDLAILGLAESIGIRKGDAFKPDDTAKEGIGFCRKGGAPVSHPSVL